MSDEEPGELTETQLSMIEAAVWVVFTVIVVLAVFYPVIAVVLLIMKWGSLALKHRVWSAKNGE